MGFMGKKTVLVTGASGGIGSAIVRAFADSCCVAVHYNKNREKAENLCRELNSAGAVTAPFGCDVSDSNQVSSMFEEIKKQLGPVDILINNAAIAQNKLVIDVSDNEWRDIIGTNLDGCFFCCREALKGMVYRQSGVIINISSIWGIAGASCEAAYSASKAGIIGLTKALAKEYGASGIRVNCIAPGVIDTEMNSNLSEEDMEDLKEQTPLGRIGNPEEIADLAEYLASDKASFITGQIISPNGGLVI